MSRTRKEICQKRRVKLAFAATSWRLPLAEAHRNGVCRAFFARTWAFRRQFL